MSSGERSPVQQGATPRNNISSQQDVIGRFLRSRNELSERQRIAVELLLRGMSDQEVAAQVGVDRSTVFRWRGNVAFQRELDRQRRILWERSAGEIQSMVSPALGILRRQLDSGDDKIATRAAGVVLRFATPSRLLPSTPHGMPKEFDEQKQYGDDLIAYVDAPMPGQPGAPEDLVDEDPDED
ncbi:MAG: helix-turn-helix domain-containing protein [Tepidisphaeraceae bacterium]